jgi:hypothetical protein
MRTRAPTRSRALALALARTRGRREHSHARTRTRARREQTERVQTFGPICTDAGRTEPGRPPGRLRVSHTSALKDRNQQFTARANEHNGRVRERERA